MRYPNASPLGRLFLAGCSYVPLSAWESALSHANQKIFFDVHLQIFRRLHRNMILAFMLAVVLSSTLPKVLALPALPLSPNPSPLHSNTSSILISTNPVPPQEPTCPETEEWGVTIGHPLYDDCDYILTNLYPKDPLARPVTRNFYTAPSDLSHTMSNVRLPYEQSFSKHDPQVPSTRRGTFELLIFEKGHATSWCF